MKKQLILFTIFSWALLYQATGAVITGQAPGGNWNQTSSWVGGVVPAANDTVRILSGTTILVTEPVVVRQLRFVNDTGSSLVKLVGATQINITGALIFGFPSRDGRQFVLDVDSGSAQVNDVRYSNSGNDSRRGILRIGTGSLVVSGIFDMSVERTSYVRRRLEITAGGSVSFNGPVINPAFLSTSPGSSVRYSASGNHDLLTGDYHHLVVSGSGTKTIGAVVVNGTARLGGGSVISLNGNIAFRDSLIFNSSVIQQNAFNVVLRGSYSLSGNFGAASHFNQNGNGLLQIIGDSASRYLNTFPIGADGKYTPVTITRLAANFPSTPGNRNMEIKTYGITHPLVSGSNAAAKRFWRIRTNNITVVTRFGVQFGYSDADVETPIVESSLTATARLRGTGWQVGFTGSSINPATNQLIVDTTNTEIDGDYTFGQPTAFPASFPYVFTVRNGNWTTASVWSGNAVPTASTDVVVLHNISEFQGSVNNVNVTVPASLSASSPNATINGTLTISGLFNDSHSGGTNTILGKVTVNPGAIVTATGSGSGGSFNFANDIENNGSWNVNANTIRFSRQVKNVIRITGSNPVNFLRTNATILSLVDTLIFSQGGSASNSSQIEPNFFVGDTSYSFNCAVVNRSALTVSNLTSRATTGFTRTFIQGENSYLGIESGIPFSGTTGVLDATAPGNTVDYRQASSQTVAAIDYHHLELNGDRSDRFKTLASGRDVVISGNLTVNQNANVFQFGTGSNGQRLTVRGNIVLRGGAQIRTSSGGNVKNTLILGGRFINNSNNGSAVQLKVSDTTHTHLIMTGSGNVAEGTGAFRLGAVTLAGTDTMRWIGSGMLEIADTLTNNSPGFHQSSGFLYVPNDARFTFQGSSNSTRFKRILFTDRADRRVTVSQKIPLAVDSLFHMQADGRTSLGASYNFAGQTLHIRGEYRVGANGGSSAMRPDSTSTLIFQGTAPASALSLATGFRRLGVLVHDKESAPLAINQPVAIHRRLDLMKGNMTGTANIRMLAGSVVRRANGSIAAAFNNTSGKYNVEYLSSLNSGPELIAVPALNKLTIQAPPADTITFTNSPTLDSNLVFVSGLMKANGNNYVRLGAASNIEIANIIPQTIFPVGTLTTPTPVDVEVVGISSGNVLIKPFVAEAPNIPVSPFVVRLKRYVELSGTSASRNVNLGFSYVDADVIGGPELFLEPKFFNGAIWISDNGNVDENLNRVSMTGISGVGTLTAYGIIESVKDKSSGSIQIYPNPTHGVVRIQTKGNAEILHLKDILGKDVIFGKTRTDQGFILDLESVSKGIYFLTIREGNVDSIVRLVKN